MDLRARVDALAARRRRHKLNGALSQNVDILAAMKTCRKLQGGPRQNAVGSHRAPHVTSPNGSDRAGAARLLHPAPPSAAGRTIVGPQHGPTEASDALPPRLVLQMAWIGGQPASVMIAQLGTEPLIAALTAADRTVKRIRPVIVGPAEGCQAGAALRVMRTDHLVSVAATIGVNGSGKGSGARIAGVGSSVATVVASIARANTATVAPSAVIVANRAARRRTGPRMNRPGGAAMTISR